MVDAAIERQLVACLGDLPIAQQRQVLEFARHLQNRAVVVGVPGSALLRFAGSIAPDDLQAMSTAIEANDANVAHR